MVFVLAFSVTFAYADESVSEEPVNGWQKVGGETYYYVDNTPVTGMQTIEGEKYYFNPSA